VKVGLILECQAEGPDEKVLCCLLAKFAPHVEVRCICLGNKANLVRECGDAATQLLADGCDHVLIIWDLYPAEWGDALKAKGKKKRPCLKEDRERIFAALDKAGVVRETASLVATAFMLESWFLADTRAVAAHLAQKTGRTITVADLGSINPRTQTKPKDALSKMFEGQKCQRYRDFADAEGIARNVENLDDLKRHSPSALPKHPSSFQRFWEKATGEE